MSLQPASLTGPTETDETALQAHRASHEKEDDLSDVCFPWLLCKPELRMTSKLMNRLGRLCRDNSASSGVH